MTRTELFRTGTQVNDINELIAGRWSSRAIDPEKEVPVDVINRIFEAGRWAPSAMNNQPWRFLVFGPEDPEALEKARSVLTAGNAWALKAPRLFFVLTRTTRPGSDKPNPRALYEAGMAAAQAALQAVKEGLVMHQMAGFDQKAVTEIFNIPEQFQPVTAVALGYPGFIEEVPENKRDLETSERTRKQMDELVFFNGAVPKE